MKKVVVMVLILLAGTCSLQAGIKGLWEFEDVSNLTAATIGNDLTLSGGSHAATAGVNAGDGAVTVPKGTYYKCNAAIAANGGGKWVNEFTLLFDIKYPQASAKKWRCFLNTNINNSNDGDYFISSNGGWGVSSIGYKNVTTSADTWYRVVMSAKLGKNPFWKVYVDGNLVATHTAGLGLDGRMSLYTSTAAYTLALLGDNDGEDADMDCSTLAIWDAPLTDTEVAALGTAGSAVPEPMTLSLLALGGLGLLRRRSSH